MDQNTATVWYKQFWPWFLIALPGSVVIASIATIIIASHNPDSIVTDDYYKAGLAINRDLSREQMAVSLDIRCTLQIDRDKNVVHAIMDTTETKSPQALHLKLIHPTLPDKDQFITLNKSTTPGIYTANTRPIGDGEWNVIIDSTSLAWRLQRRVTINDTLNNLIIR